MINVGNLIMDAWHELLDGNIGVPVYRVDAPPEENGDYVLLRIESQTESNNNARFVSNVVLITDVVTRNKSRINDAKAGVIDSKISELLFQVPGKHLLPVQPGITIPEIRRSDVSYLGEDDGSHRYYRIITRNSHRVVQHLVNSTQN